MIEDAKARETRNRAAKTKVIDRVRTFVIYFDLRKAFDAVPRQLLLEKLRGKGVSNQLLEAFRNLLSGTKVTIG